MTWAGTLRRGTGLSGWQIREWIRVDGGAHFEFDGAQVLGDVFGVWFEGWFSGGVFFFYADCGLCACDVVGVELAEEGEDLEV